jgi:hypothetical protein
LTILARGLSRPRAVEPIRAPPVTRGGTTAIAAAAEHARPSEQHHTAPLALDPVCRSRSSGRRRGLGQPIRRSYQPSPPPQSTPDPANSTTRRHWLWAQRVGHVPAVTGAASASRFTVLTNHRRRRRARPTQRTAPHGTTGSGPSVSVMFQRLPAWSRPAGSFASHKAGHRGPLCALEVGRYPGLAGPHCEEPSEMLHTFSFSLSSFSSASRPTSASPSPDLKHGQVRAAAG